MSSSFSHALVNGEIIPFSEAQISLDHPIFLTAFGVYEAIQVDCGRPFHLKDHLERLEGSAEAIEIQLPTIDVLIEWGLKLVKTLPPITYALQILVLSNEFSVTDPLIVFLPKPIRTYPPEYFTTGAKAITYEGRRALPQCKSFNTLVSHLARMAAQKASAVEAILTHQNELFEGARSNVFVVEATTNCLLTPPAGRTLSGITKDIVIHEMQDTPYPVQEATIFLDTPITEMFITSTSMHVLPVTILNGQRVGGGEVGPITKRAMERFAEYYTKYLANFDLGSGGLG